MRFFPQKDVWNHKAIVYNLAWALKAPPGKQYPLVKSSKHKCLQKITNFRLVSTSTKWKRFHLKGHRRFCSFTPGPSCKQHAVMVVLRWACPEETTHKSLLNMWHLWMLYCTVTYGFDIFMARWLDEYAISRDTRYFIPSQNRCAEMVSSFTNQSSHFSSYMPLNMTLYTSHIRRPYTILRPSYPSYSDPRIQTAPFRQRWRLLPENCFDLQNQKHPLEVGGLLAYLLWKKLYEVMCVFWLFFGLERERYRGNLKRWCHIL